MRLRLKEIRESKGLKQESIAKYVNCSKSAISSYETGRTSVPIGILIKLADLYGVTVDYLIGRDVYEFNALSDQEKELIQATRESHIFVQKNIVDVIRLLNRKTHSDNLSNQVKE